MSYLLIIILSQIVITYIAVFVLERHMHRHTMAIAATLDIMNEGLINGIRSIET